MTYKTDFGSTFDLGFNPKGFPFLKDKSFMNDVCPSFWFKVEENYFTLWVDYPNSSDRESDGLRYTVITSENLGDIVDPDIISSDGEITFECDDSEELIHYFDSLLLT